MPVAISHELVLKKLQDCFPDPAVAKEALKSLERYGDREWHMNQEIVRLAILKLSGGELWRLRDYVQVARADFRDVIFAAQCPEQSRLTKEAYPLLSRGLSSKQPSAAEEAAVRKRDQDQWETWLSSSGA